MRVQLCVLVLLVSSLVPLKAQEDIVDVAAGAGVFNTLLTAVGAANLEATLRSDGPFTVFAPTDDAFAAVPAETLNALLADTDALTQVLLYHVVVGAAVPASDVVGLTEVETANGQSLPITIDGSTVRVGDATVVQTDVQASNGIIHVIDTVLIPPADLADIVDTAVGAGIFNTLVTAVGAANLEATLRSDGPFTVFAPTDDAFAAVPAETLNALLADPDALTQVLLYHVVAGAAVPASDVVNLTEVETANGKSLPISVDGGTVHVGDATVIQTDVEASNGIIHVIDSVLIPPADLLDIVDTAVGAGIFNTLVTAVGAANLEATLRSEGPFTVFAPTDDAFAAIPDETLNALLADQAALTEVLLYHVVAGAAVPAADVVNLTEVETAGGKILPITVSDAGVMVGDANVITTDVEASNGIIHIIDGVLIPPAELKDIVDTALEAGRFNTLAAALDAAGLVDALRGDGPFTVFAPNDDAFAKLPEGTVEALLADPETLSSILLYHVVPGSLEASDVVSRNQVRTLNGNRAAINADSSGAYIDQASIITTDIQASNGIIHEINEVILPQELTGTTYEVTITNATKGQTFAPPLIVTHAPTISLYKVGYPASDGLKVLAEEGSAETLVDEIYPSGDRYDIVTLDAPLGPGESVTVEVKTDGAARQISVATMLVNTNDTFLGASVTAPRSLDYFKTNVPAAAATHEYAFAYDAGSEANSEDCAHVPGCGGAGATPDSAGEGFVHIANGIHGVGDLDPATYTWQGPVGIITVKSK